MSESVPRHTGEPEIDVQPKEDLLGNLGFESFEANVVQLRKIIFSKNELKTSQKTQEIIDNAGSITLTVEKLPLALQQIKLVLQTNLSEEKANSIFAEIAPRLAEKTSIAHIRMISEEASKTQEKIATLVA